jgi:hypothetical protein
MRANQPRRNDALGISWAASYQLVIETQFAVEVPAFIPKEKQQV